MRKQFFWFAAMGILITLGGCSSGPPALPSGWTFRPDTLQLEYPAHFIAMEIPADNPLTRQGVALGRKLFYDPVLSRDSSLSCASCHRQDLAFTDGQARSTGVLGFKGPRSAMSLVNVGFYYKGLFWDGRTATLEEQALIPVSDHAEMAASWPGVEERLRVDSVYGRMFYAAFGIRPEAIDRYWVGKALAQFQRTLISYDARFDRVMAGQAEFTPQEKRGWQIFFDASEEVPHAECGHCHVDPLFTNLAFENNGLDAVAGLEEHPDKGRGLVTGRYTDLGRFRVPTLRNILLTAPYMHDGRFETIEEVLDHYSSGGHPALNVSANVRPLGLQAADKQDLIAFLGTLTDTAFLTNAAFADPRTEIRKQAPEENRQVQ